MPTMVESHPHMALLTEKPAALEPLVDHGRKSGWTITSVGTSTALLEKVAEGELSLVLLDSDLRQCNWVAVCKHLRRAFPRVPVLLLLKHSRIYLRKQAFEAGIADYIVLPLIPHEATGRVRAALAETSEPDHACSGDLRPGAGGVVTPGILLSAAPAPGGAASVSAPGQTSAAPPVPAHDASPIRVLVAEDDRHIATLVRHYLTHAGWEVSMAEDGEKAEQFINDSTFEFIVLDNYMPYRSGFELLTWMRESHKKGRSRVIMVSADGREDTVIRAFALGADDFIAKPFSPSLLVSRIQRFLGTPAGA